MSRPRSSPKRHTAPNGYVAPNRLHSYGYLLDELGMSRNQLLAMRRSGLEIRQLGRSKAVMGADFIAAWEKLPTV